MKEPIEWKSPQWWRNRPVEERVEFIRAPKRIRTRGEDITSDLADDWEQGDSILITGGEDRSLVGYGLAKSLVNDHKVSARFISAEQYIEMLKDSFDNDGLLPTEYSSPYTVKNLKGVFDVVVLDGLGDERLTEFAAHEMGTLIRTRWDKMLTTIVTTRLNLTEVRARYGERLASPLSEFDLEIV